MDIYDIDEKELLKLLEEKYSFTDDEVQEIISYFEKDREEGDDGRWDRPIYSVIEVCNRYFGINWYKGLTEYQDNYYDEHVFEEVKPVKKMIEIIEWKLKN